MLKLRLTRQVLGRVTGRRRRWSVQAVFRQRRVGTRHGSDREHFWLWSVVGTPRMICYLATLVSEINLSRVY